MNTIKNILAILCLVILALPVVAFAWFVLLKFLHR